MKLTYSWLKDHLDTDAPIPRIAETLTAIGLEVEQISFPNKSLTQCVVGHVITTTPHPHADRLQLCRVDIASEVVQVICGAPNARVGLKSIFAPPGVTLPGIGMPLTSRTILGVDSHGMLCSEHDLALSEDHTQIIELSEASIIGSSAGSSLGLDDDAVIEIGLTPNRADCAGIYGIARDLAAAGLGKLKPLDIPVLQGRDASTIHVSIKDNVACPVFLGRLIRNVRNGPSPRWLQKYLTAIGLRPRSALVDITNYLTFDLARPLHVFDADKLTGHLTVRLSQNHETFTGLDDKTYVLDDAITVICDDKQIVSLGGVMGGNVTGCGEETVNVFVECALFDPIRTSTTAQTLDIDSDAAYRFARGVDPEGVVPGLERATRLILDLCGGEPSQTIMAGTLPNKHKTLIFQPSRVTTLSGVAVPLSQQSHTLRALGFSVTEETNGTLTVSVPSWRHDIHEDVDLVEEIIRLYGFDAIPTVPMRHGSRRGVPRLHSEQKRCEMVRKILALRSFYEVVTWSFMASDLARFFGFTNESLRLCNPISTTLEVMRPSILPNLLQAVRRNAHRGYQDVCFFEVGPTYHDTGDKGQRSVAAGIRSGWVVRRHWAAESRLVDVFDVKGDVLGVLETLGIAEDDLVLHPEPPSWYHPGRGGGLYLKGRLLAWFGEIHPRILHHMDIKRPIVGFEILLDDVPCVTDGHAPRKRLQLSAFQSVVRDFAFVVDQSVTAERLLSAARGVDKELIQNVEIFDVYVDSSVGEAKKSVALAVTLQAKDRTLTNREIEALSDAIIAAIMTTTGAVLRRDVTAINKGEDGKGG